MTLCVVSSNEDAQQQQHQQSTNLSAAIMEVDEPTAPQSQDSGYASQPISFSRAYLGQNLRITACANQGGRKYMEDRVHVRVHRDEDGAVDWTYVAVYDGHGGPEASEYCRQHLLKNITSEKGFESEDDCEFLEAIRSGFLKTHHSMWKEVDTWERTASGYPSTAGTTASCAFIRRGKVYIGHVGDSAIILTKRTGANRHVRLTEDHKPELPAERLRIEASGGSVMQKQCVYRVVWTRPSNAHVGPVRRTTPVQTIPFLAVARSLGDFWSYIESTQEFSVSPCPDVSVTPLSPDHHALVLVSDGLTNVMSSDAEAAIMYDLAVEEEQHNFTEADEPPNHARILLRRALQGWRRFRADNVSVLAVVFSDAERDASQERAAEASRQREQRAVDEERRQREMEFEKEGRVVPNRTWRRDKSRERPPAPPVELPLSADVDAQLVEHPLCMMHVTNDRVRRFETAPVTMRYNGTKDDKFVALTSSIGPGFVSTDAEKDALQYVDDEMEEEWLRADAVDICTWRARVARLEECYDLLGTNGERDVTPENQPPPTSTRNLTNLNGTTTTYCSTVGPMEAERRTSTAAGLYVYTSAAAQIIHELRSSGDAAVAGAAAAVAAAAASTAAADGAEERPATPENRADVSYVVLRSSRSTGKRKSRLFLGDDEGAPTTSGDVGRIDEDEDEDEELAEGEQWKRGHEDTAEEASARWDAQDRRIKREEALLKMSLPFADDERALRTPSPIGDALLGDDSKLARATPLCNTVATEREVIKRVTRSAAATTSVCAQREMVVMERPATRRSSARRLLGDDATAAPSSLSSSSAAGLRTYKMLLELDETIVDTTTLTSVASRTRSRNGEMTPPPSGCSSTPLAAMLTASGSRKRPRTATADGYGGGGGSGTTPLLARISLTEMNENAESSQEASSDETAPKSDPPNKSVSTASRWARVPLRKEEDVEEAGYAATFAGEKETFYEVHPLDDDDDEYAQTEEEEEEGGEPPAKRFRLWRMIRNWWTGSL